MVSTETCENQENKSKNLTKIHVWFILESWKGANGMEDIWLFIAESVTVSLRMQTGLLFTLFGET